MFDLTQNNVLNMSDVIYIIFYWSQNASQSYALSVQDFSCYTLLKMLEVKE